MGRSRIALCALEYISILPTAFLLVATVVVCFTIPSLCIEIHRSHDTLPRRHVPHDTTNTAPTQPTLSDVAFTRHALLEPSRKRLRHALQTRSTALVYTSIVLPLTLIFLGLLLIFFAHHLCVASSPDALSTYFTRSRRPPVCPTWSECYTYTLVDETCSTLRVVSHLDYTPVSSYAVAPGGVVPLFTDEDASYLEVTFELESDELMHGPTPRIHSSGVVWRTYGHAEAHRVIAHATLGPLRPLQFYRYRTVYRNTRTGSVLIGATRRIRGIPCSIGTHDETLSFVNGGDLRNDARGWDVLRMMRRSTPDASFFVLGGDIAYANSLCSCYRRWDTLFRTYNQIMSSIAVPLNGQDEVFDLPIMAAIGNHEATLPFLPQRPPSFYIDFFPYAGPSEFEGVLHAHRITDHIGFIALDSGSVYTAAQQVAYLRSTLEAMIVTERRPVVIVFYHKPCYPSHRSYTSSFAVQQREYWVPLFDQYGVTLALEHHDHKYKRTRPLRSSQPVADTTTVHGVVYVGDGALGVYSSKRSSEPTQARDLFEVTANSNYALSMKVRMNPLRPPSAHPFFVVAGVSLDSNGQAIDRFEIEAAPRIV